MSMVSHLGYFPAFGRFAWRGEFPSGDYGPKPCIVPPPTGYEGYYPFQMSLEDAMRAYWIGKRYRITGSLTIDSVTYDYGIAVNSSTSETSDVIMIPSVTGDESDLVCGNQFWTLALSVGPYEPPWETPASGEIMFNPPFVFSPSLQYGPAVALVGTDLYSPMFVFSGNLSNISTNPLDIPGPVLSPATLEFWGYSLPIYQEPSLTVSSGVLTMTATEYWPHDPGDGGGPIWDSVTGDLLRPEIFP